MTGLVYPNISPIIFQIGPFALRWYSLAYLVGILLGWWLALRRVDKYKLPLKKSDIEDIVFYLTLGIILGGRLGYVLFYGTSKFWENPLELFEIWHGGMSFHGGIIGVIIAVYLVSRKIKYPFLKITDLASPLVPFGIFFGRLANFINDELWGRVTDVPWAVRFPQGGFLPRHPSQLYEACLEGIVLAIILNLLWCSKWCRERTGFISSIFLLGYAVFRSFVEQFREPDAQLGFFWEKFTMGQILSLLISLIGAYLLLRVIRAELRERE